MSNLEQYKALIKEITDRANDKYYDTKLIANAVYWILEQMADRKTEPQTEEWHDDCNTCRWHEGACTIPCCDYEPQTDKEIILDPSFSDAWCIIGDCLHFRHNGVWVRWRIWSE